MEARRLVLSRMGWMALTACSSIHLWCPILSSRESSISERIASGRRVTEEITGLRFLATLLGEAAPPSLLWQWRRPSSRCYTQAPAMASCDGLRTAVEHGFRQLAYRIDS